MKHLWFPFYDGDFVTATMHLNPTELGCYIRLLIHAYNHHGEIPLDTIKLSTITGCERRFWWRFGAPIVTQFFDAVDGSTAQHKRVLSELQRSAEISSKRKAAAQQMHSKRSANAHANGGVITAQHIDKEEPPTALAPSNGSGGGGSPALSEAERDRLMDGFRRQHEREEQARRYATRLGAKSQ